MNGREWLLTKMNDDKMQRRQEAFEFGSSKYDCKVLALVLTTTRLSLAANLAESLLPRGSEDRANKRDLLDPHNATNQAAQDNFA